jgi:hypothetical protein
MQKQISKISAKSQTKTRLVRVSFKIAVKTGVPTGLVKHSMNGLK